MILKACSMYVKRIKNDFLFISRLESRSMGSSSYGRREWKWGGASFPQTSHPLAMRSLVASYGIALFDGTFSVLLVCIKKNTVMYAPDS